MSFPIGIPIYIMRVYIPRQAQSYWCNCNPSFSALPRFSRVPPFRSYLHCTFIFNNTSNWILDVGSLQFRHNRQTSAINFNTIFDYFLTIPLFDNKAKKRKLTKQCTVQKNANAMQRIYKWQPCYGPIKLYCLFMQIDGTLCKISHIQQKKEQIRDNK